MGLRQVPCEVEAKAAHFVTPERPKPANQPRDDRVPVVVGFVHLTTSLHLAPGQEVALLEELRLSLDFCLLPLQRRLVDRLPVSWSQASIEKSSGKRELTPSGH
jgi:hypothetical protein